MTMSSGRYSDSAIGLNGRPRSRLPGLEDDVDVVGELEEELDTVCAVQIERQGSLASGVVPPVEAAFGAGLVVEERSVAAADIAAGRLNLDHVCAESGQEFAGEVTSGVGTIEYSDAVERSHG